ncbi:Beta-ketoacyl-ACP synthase [Hyphomicrobium sp. 1Nfss2.1]|uniref:beta-ketoacyl-ACP synthase n=1 Tax=Hyphomicrobium sp. 1Nfss2.1 TaxID=3413936 RepID=UPI003C7BA943
MTREQEHVWITGIGLVSSIGEGVEEHWSQLSNPQGCIAKVEERRFAPYPVHPLVPLALARQIPRTTDQRQMERWHRIGVYAAGLALGDAALAGDQELLDRTDLSIAAGNGERDIAFDSRVLAALDAEGAAGAALNRDLMTGLRPTLYLGQLSNLLAGNVSIVHGATGSSRTFKSEEMAGVSALQNAFDRIASGESDIVLVGGALNAEREDILLGSELEQILYRGSFKSVWERRGDGGGAVLGSLGAFLVLESARHARQRDRQPYARIGAIAATRSRRLAGDATAALSKLFSTMELEPTANALCVLSGASGVEPATSEEQQFLANLPESGHFPAVRAWGSLFGHGREAHFIVGIALAALALAKGRYYPPFGCPEVDTPAEGPPDRILVTTVGTWRGEALSVVVPALHGANHA